MAAKVTINGRTFVGANSVSIVNGKVFIDGREAEGEDLWK
jgi:hypothetical protein